MDAFVQTSYADAEPCQWHASTVHQERLKKRYSHLRKSVLDRKGSPSSIDEQRMIKHFDHATVCVRDLEATRHLFGLLGFEEDKALVMITKRLSA